MTQASSARSALLAAAAGLTVVTVAYGLARASWGGWEPRAWLGFTFDHTSLELVTVDPDGPASRTRLKPFDRIEAVNGRPTANHIAVYDELRKARPGEPVRLRVKLGGLGDVTTLEMFGEPHARTTRSLAGSVRDLLVGLSPLLLFLVTARALLFSPDDRYVWLLALIFAGFVASIPLDPIAHGIPPWLRGAAYAYKVLFAGIAPAMLAYLFAVFPGRSPLDQRFPEVKTYWLAASAGVAWPGALWVLASPEAAQRGAARVAFVLSLLSWVAAIALSLASAAPSASSSASADARCRISLAGHGAAAGALSALVLWVAGSFSLWISLPAAGAMLLFPLAWVHAVVARDVPDARVLAQRIARQLLLGRARVGLFIVVGSMLGLSLADGVQRLARQLGAAALPLGVGVGLAVAVALVWGAERLHPRFRERIESSFFRGAVEARRALQNLAQNLRAAQTANDLALQLERQLHHALVPISLAIYLKHDAERLKIARGMVPEEFEEIPLDAPMLPLGAGRKSRAIGGLDRVVDLGGDCLVPIAGRETGLLGLIVLGPRSSREPYTEEDKRLLGAVGGAAAGVLFKSAS